MKPHWMPAGLFAFAVVGVVGLLRWDMVVEVSYRPVEVHAVQVLERHGRFMRHVTVEIDGRRRGIWLSDPHVAVAPGARVCLEERHLLLRRWTIYALQLPQYCPGLRPAPVAPVARQPGLSAGQVLGG